MASGRGYDMSWAAVWNSVLVGVTVTVLATLGAILRDHDLQLRDLKHFSTEHDALKNTVSGLSFDFWLLCNNQRKVLDAIHIDRPTPDCSRPREALIPTMEAAPDDEWALDDR